VITKMFIYFLMSLFDISIGICFVFAKGLQSVKT